MFAIVRTGGKQYRVAPGDKIVVEKLDGNAGDSITLSDVLLAGDGSDLKSVEGLTVAAEIIAQAKGDKVVVFKKRRRHNYRRKKGHRQQHTILRITAVGDKKAEKSSANTAAAPAASETASEGTAPAKAPRKTKAASNPAPEDAVSNEGVVPADAGTEATHDVTSDAAPAKKTKKAAAAPKTEEK